MGTAGTRSTPRPAPWNFAERRDAPSGLDALALLDAHGLRTAPHVAARLASELAGDPEALLQTARALRPAQRLGHASIPDPLPVVPAVATAMAQSARELGPFDRRVLLTAAVCVGDRTDLLLAASDCSMADLLDAASSRHLLLVAGHFAFADPRMRAWIHGMAALADRTEVHAALAAAHQAAGAGALSVWHRALSTLEGDPELVEPLLAFANAVDAEGDADRAHAIAREAAGHARGAAHERAALVAGLAALHAGLVDDAVGWLEIAAASSEPRTAGDALPVLVHAVGLRSGHVPAELLAIADAALPGEPMTADGQRSMRSAARAYAVAACADVEAGDPASAARRFARAAELGGDDPAVVAAREWCGFLGAAPVGRSAAASGDPTAATSPVPQDPAAAVRRFCETGALGGVDLCARAPLVRAAEALLQAHTQLGRGEVERAAHGLTRAAADLPLALPLGGLGVILARRLDVLRTGAVGVLGASIAASTPAPWRAPIRVGEQGDLALVAFLDGRYDEAESLSSLAGERCRAAGPGGLAVPGLGGADESPEVTAGRTSGGPAAQDTATLAEVRRLATAAAREADIRRGHEAAERAAKIVSTYRRGQAELLVAQAYAACSTPAATRRHLVAASTLFRESGAEAWVRLVEGRLRELVDEPGRAIRLEPPDSADHGRSGLATSGADRAGPDGGPLQSGGGTRSSATLADRREEWAALLTARELEVAMLIAGGASNRDISSALFVSVRTVEVHVSRIFAKLDVRSRLELAVRAHGGTPA